MQIMPVQKQTSAGQRTRFRACVAVGDADGHLGLGTKCAKEVAGAIRGAIINAKLSICPIRRGYWGSKLGRPHTVPGKVTGNSGSVRVRLIPAPRGTGLVAGPASKKLLAMAGISDCYTSSTGHTRTLGNFVKATFVALKATYGFLEPTLWEKTEFGVTPYQEHTDFLSRDASVKKSKDSDGDRPRY
jgi:small subunit ribosomal protein S2e